MVAGKLSKKEGKEGSLDRSFAGSAAEVNRFVFEIVDGADVADGATAGPHENRMGDGFVTDQFDSWEKGTFDDPGGAEDGALAGDDIGGPKYGLDLFFRNTMDLPGFGFGIGEPHA